MAIKAVSLNFRDLAVVTGRYPRNASQPTIIASDGSGEVIAVGEAVTAFQTGDRVAGSFFQKWITGPFAREYGASALGGAIDGVLTRFRVFDQEGLLRIPEHLSYEEGATLPCAGLTAWNALAPTAHVQAGDTVLLLGTGGVSIFGLQFAKLHGARVIITSSSDEKLARAKALGADETINYKTHARMGQRGAAPHRRQRSRHRTRSGRRRNFPPFHELGPGVGANRRHRRAQRAWRATCRSALIGLQTLSVRGIFVGSVAMFEDMNRAIAANQLRPVIDRVFPFEQSADALRYHAKRATFRQNRHLTVTTLLRSIRAKI